MKLCKYLKRACESYNKAVIGLMVRLFCEKMWHGANLASYFFTVARKMLKRKLALFTRIAVKVCDDDGRTIVLHLKLN